MAEAVAKSQELGKLDQIRWFTRALVKGDPALFYSSLHELVVPDQGDASCLDARFWFNMGYWKEARTYADAGAALAVRLADAAGLAPGHVVLDAGFGFGEQDLLWARQYDVKRIVGLNITLKQVDFARQRVDLAGLADRVDLRLGDAMDPPFQNNTFDTVLALESAHHFRPREAFFAQAARVLKPGGMLGVADIIAAREPKDVNHLQAWMTRRMTGSPGANFYSRDVYAKKLAKAGFVDVKVESIREYVFPGNFAYYLQKIAGNRADAIVIGEIDPTTADMAYKKWGSVGMGDYVIATARKPAAA